MNLEDFKKLNKEKGFHWFDRDTISFFKTRVIEYHEDSGLFITAETNPENIQRYSVRKANFQTGQVKTVGEFHSHQTVARARKALKEFENDK